MDPELEKLYINELGDDETWRVFECVITALKKIRSIQFNCLEYNRAELWGKKIIQARLERKRKNEIKERLEDMTFSLK